MGFLSTFLRLLVILALLTGCQPLKLDDLKDGPLALLKSKGNKGSVGSRNVTLESSFPLEKIIDSARQSRNIGPNFRSTVGML